MSVLDIVARIDRNATALRTSMLSKLVEECDRLFLGKSSAANALVESTQVSKCKGNTSNMFTVTKVALLASSHSITNILQVSIRCVSDTSNSTSGATTAVDTKASDKEIVAALLVGYRTFRRIAFGRVCLFAAFLVDSRALTRIAAGRVYDDVDSQLTVSNVVARVSRDATAKLAAMIDDLLKERLSLGKGKAAVSNVLIERTNGWVAADVVDVNAANMLAVPEGLVGVDGPDLGNELAESTFVATAKAAASAVDP